MRTFIDLPPALMRAARTRAAEHGESIEELVIRAVAREVGLPAAHKTKPDRVTLPLIAPDATPSVHVTTEVIADALNNDDVDRRGVR